MEAKEAFAACFDQIIPTEAQREAMLRGILQNEPEAAPRRKRSAGRIAALAAAALLVLATATAVAAVGFGWHKELLRYLRPTEDQLSSLENAVDFPEATVTKNGVTVTVQQTLADPYGIYVVYEITAPEDFVFTEEVTQSVWPKVEVDDGGSGLAGGIGGSEVLEDAGNRRTALCWLNMDRPFVRGKAKLLLKDLVKVRYSKTLYDPEVLIPGEWELEWEFQYEDTSRTVEPNIPVSIGGSKNTVTKVVVSSLGVYLFVEGDDLLDSARPVIRFQNGEEIVYDSNSKNKNFMYGLTDQEKMIYENDLFYRFDRMIDPWEVESIRLGDTVIPLS